MNFDRTMNHTGVVRAENGLTVADLVRRHAFTRPRDIALSDLLVRRTYGELDERLSRITAVLRSHQVASGDRIAVLGSNSVPTFEALIAPARLGAISVPLNFRLAPPELAYVLQDSGAKMLFTSPEYTAIAKTLISEHALSIAVIEIGDELESFLLVSEPDQGVGFVDDHSDAFIMYTSGTTGNPKGAVLTHRNLFLLGTSLITDMGIGLDDRVWLCGSPLFHIASLAGIMPQIIAGGRSIIVPTGSFDPRMVLELIQSERVTSCGFVPVQWSAICEVENLADYDQSSLLRAAWGAAPASVTLLEKIAACFPNASVQSSFGQTESTGTSCVLVGDAARRKIGSVGRPLINVEVRIVDDADHDVAPGDIGEIVYRGPLIMSRYWNNPSATEEAFSGGWFHSGDFVRQDDEGYLYVVDRKKDMIISGGENIYSVEVENVLAGHPEIAEVAVIGVPDDRWGETPLAVIVPRNPGVALDIEALNDFCQGRLANYKRPRHLAIVDEIPRNASGKILKTALRGTFSGTDTMSAPSV